MLVEMRLSDSTQSFATDVVPVTVSELTWNYAAAFAFPRGMCVLPSRYPSPLRPTGCVVWPRTAPRMRRSPSHCLLF